ncbi:MAG: hypothetical protein RI906_3553 [Pseudomonadota bacterium]
MTKHLITIADLNPDDVDAIFALVGSQSFEFSARRAVAWSFEGNGIRTRASFIQAFRELRLSFTELPNLLKTHERAHDLAAYLAPLFDLFVIRESDHGRLADFAHFSPSPVINAMSAQAHPCEVLTDAYFIQQSIKPLRDARIVLWGPTTNVYHSWHELAALLGFSVIQVCDQSEHENLSNVKFSVSPPSIADVVITDRHPAAVENAFCPLTLAHLQSMGKPALLPTPPFSVGGEMLFDPASYPEFVGYEQKSLLVPVQKAVITHLLNTE